MEVIERIIWFAIGGTIGFILGFVVRTLVDIKSELDEVVELERKELRCMYKNDNENGALRLDIFANVALLVVIIVTVYAAFVSQHAANTSKNAQTRIDRVTICNQQAITETIRALNERTTFTQAQATANVKLQKAQAKFFALLLHKPPESEAVRSDAALTYLQSLNDFVELSSKSADKATQFPYPSTTELTSCVNIAKKEAQ